ncbi:hypothetical protein MUO74_06460 [Candidatus Bathyarchaeota archaeon]|nr:hypothetical protein [Candidatus Bathyarchaeota archaeon]
MGAFSRSMLKSRVAVFSLTFLVVLASLLFTVPIVKADTYNQIPLWINVMEGSGFTSEQKDQIEQEMDAIFAKAGLNWRVTSIVLEENYTDPDKSNDQPGEVRIGPEENGLYTNGSKEVENLAGAKMFVVKKILNETGGNSGFLGGSEIVPGTRTIVVASTRSNGSLVDGQVWAHELGHILGLNHTYANGTERSSGDLMYRYAMGGTNLTAGDIAQMNQTKEERELGVPKLTEDQLGRNYDEYFSEAEDPLGDSLYGFTDIVRGFFSFFVLDETEDLYITTSLAELIPAGVGFTFSVAMDTDNDPATGGEFQGWLGIDFLIIVNAMLPGMVEGILYKYPEMLPIVPLETRIDTRLRHRCNEGPPEIPSIPVQNTIVIKLPLVTLGPISDPILVGMHIQSADGLGWDKFGIMPLQTSSPKRPVLDFDPPVAPSNTLITASGNGFTPTNRVSIVFNHMNLSTTNVELDGTFSTTFVVPDLPPGHYMADAIDDSHVFGVAVFTITPTVYVHDVSMDSVLPSKSVVCENYTAEIKTKVRNSGGYVESFFDVYCYVSDFLGTYEVGMQTISLDPNETADLVFMWDTNGFARGDYTVWAYAEPVAGETNTADNAYVDGIITVTMQGDLNADNVVDIFDIVRVAVAFGAVPTDPNWDPNADINGDNIIDIFDIVIVGIHFGETS